MPEKQLRPRLWRTKYHLFIVSYHFSIVKIQGKYHLFIVKISPFHSQNILVIHIILAPLIFCDIMLLINMV